MALKAPVSLYLSKKLIARLKVLSEEISADYGGRIPVSELVEDFLTEKLDSIEAEERAHKEASND